ncbi:MAG: PQQ-dependent sugar dehydrogenase [Cyanobacteria bacterium P01_A01_bin.105]
MPLAITLPSLRPGLRLRSTVVGLTLLTLVGCTQLNARVPEGAPEVNNPQVGDAEVGEPELSGGAIATTTYQIIPVVQGLERPWGITWLPDGTILVTERPGRLRIIENGQLARRPVDGLPNIFARGQGGLLDIAAHPQFSNNGLLYFTYSTGNNTANRTEVARARFDGENLSDWQVIFTVDRDKNRTQHFGARLTWLPDGTLLVSIGDGGNPPVALDGEVIRLQAQNVENALGAVIRIADDGTIPTDNPALGGNPAVWSYGHRNIQGMAYNSLTGDVWATEHGARGGDELNRLQAGENYGWPLVSYSQEYSADQPVAPVTSAPDKIDPKLVWTPSIAPSGLMAYSGDAFPHWRGDLFAGALVNRDIRRIDISADGSVTEAEYIPIGQRVRDVQQGPDGFIYVLTDEDNGQLLRIEPQS